jgi:hypothetical protein
MSYYTGTGKRHLTVSPYTPDRVELIGNNTKQASSTDIGKAVKLSGNTVVVCADGDEIYGFISSVEAGSKDGYSIGSVVCDAGREVWANDLAGGLAVGDLVVSSTSVALGTAHHANGWNVKARTGSTVSGQSLIHNSGGLAIKTAGSALVKSVNTIYALVGGTLVKKTATDMAALSGTVTADKFNVYAFFIDAAGTLTTVMGTEGDTLAAVVMPQASATRAMIGYVIINPTGTGNFVGGTTALDDATVVPTAAYVDTVGPVAQADQIVGDHKWQVIGLEVSPSTANKQVLLRKI